MTAFGLTPYCLMLITFLKYSLEKFLFFIIFLYKLIVFSEPSPVMTENFYWVVTETGHDPRLYFEKYSLWRIFELGILQISFRRVIFYTIQAIKIIQDFIFCVFEIFLGHDRNGPWAYIGTHFFSSFKFEFEFLYSNSKTRKIRVPKLENLI